MATLKTLSEYSVDFNRGFQGFSMANLEKGRLKTFTARFFKQISIYGTNFLSILIYIHIIFIINSGKIWLDSHLN